MKCIVLNGSTSYGIVTAAIGRQIQNSGCRIDVLKINPCLNCDASQLSPTIYGEIFVLEDGTQVDTCLGTYERELGITCTKKNYLTFGSLFLNAMEASRCHKFEGRTVSDENMHEMILEKIGNFDCEVLIIEIERGSQEKLFVNALKKLKHKYECVIINLGNWIPSMDGDIYLKSSISKSIPESVENGHIFDYPDLELLTDSDSIFVKCNFLIRLFKKLKISPVNCVVEKNTNNKFVKTLRVGIIGKYKSAAAYMSLIHAIEHSSKHLDCATQVEMIDSDEIETEKLRKCDCIIVAGGFGNRGIEGKIFAAHFARENRVPFLGICLGLQIVVIEIFRNVYGFEDANSTEFNQEANIPVITQMNKNRSGACEISLNLDSRIAKIYGKNNIFERYRHSYAVNKDYLEKLEKCISITGESIEAVETLELPDHPFFIATQYHPELLTKKSDPHPLITELLRVTIKELA